MNRLRASRVRPVADNTTITVQLSRRANRQINPIAIGISTASRASRTAYGIETLLQGYKLMAYNGRQPSRLAGGHCIKLASSRQQVGEASFSAADSGE